MNILKSVCWTSKLPESHCVFEGKEPCVISKSALFKCGSVSEMHPPVVTPIISFPVGGLSSLKKLHSLNVSYNQLITSKTLGEAPTVQHLDLSHNHLPLVDDLDKLGLLQWLDVSGNNLLQVGGSKLMDQSQGLGTGAYCHDALAAACLAYRYLTDDEMFETQYILGVCLLDSIELLWKCFHCCISHVLHCCILPGSQINQSDLTASSGDDWQ